MQQSRVATCGTVIDASMGVITTLDIIMDIFVLTIFFNEGKMIFFGVSIGVFILAQLLNVGLFYSFHLYRDNHCRTTISLICTIPFAPILWLIWSLLSPKESCLGRFIDKYLICFYFNWHDKIDYHDDDVNNLDKWLENRYKKNALHISQTIYQSFPQCILQIVYILYYEQTNNVILTLSILASILNICSKAGFLLVFIHKFMRIKMMIYICLTVIVDFIGIIFIISFIFYHPSNDVISSYFIVIREIYIWELIICIMPLVIYALIVGIGMLLFGFVMFMVEDGSDIVTDLDICESPLKLIGCLCIALFVGVPACICGLAFILVLTSLAITISIIYLFFCCTLWTLFVPETMGISQRMPHEGFSRTFYSDYIHWIMDESTKKQSRIIKLCIFNKVVLQNHNILNEQDIDRDRYERRHGKKWNNYYDTGLIDYLDKHEKSNFNEACLKEMRLNCIVDKATMNSSWLYNVQYTNPIKLFNTKAYLNFFNEIMHDFKNADELCEKCRLGILVILVSFLCYIIGPIYLLSRILKLSLPFFIILYLYIDGNINLFVDADIFQSMIWIIYALIICLWFTSLCLLLNEEYYLWHILPSTKNLRGGSSYWYDDRVDNYDKVRKQINDCYFKITAYPLIENILREKFGSDIMHIIMVYLNSIEVNEDQILIEQAMPPKTSNNDKEIFIEQETTVLISYNDDAIDKYTMHNTNEIKPRAQKSIAGIIID